MRFVEEFLVCQLLQVDYWATHMGFIDQQKKKRLDEDAYLSESFETVLFEMMRFQTIKEIDLAVFQEIKQEGPLGFDKYRNFIIQQADDAEKLGAKYKQLFQ